MPFIIKSLKFPLSVKKNSISDISLPFLILFFKIFLKFEGLIIADKLFNLVTSISSKIIFNFFIFGSVVSKDKKSIYTFMFRAGIDTLLYAIFGFSVSKNKLISFKSILYLIVLRSRSIFLPLEAISDINLLNLLVSIPAVDRMTTKEKNMIITDKVKLKNIFLIIYF